MFSSIYKNKDGLSLVESLVAIVLVSIGILALLTMQPTSMRAGAKSDYIGRGIMLLNKELTDQELFLMNPCNTPTPGNFTKTVNVSGRNVTITNDGDATYNVSTQISSINTNTWRVTVEVTWPPFYANGVKESLIVTRQEPFRFGCT
jgi:prepilin-type N-terminal cleavage/methylation domain-containing protein